MSRNNAAPPASRRPGFLFLTVGIILALATVFLAMRNGTPLPAGSGNEASAGITIEYTSEHAQGETVEAVVNSPLRVTARMNAQRSQTAAVLSDVRAQFVDEAGKPAQFDGKVEAPFAMDPTYEPGVWVYNTSVPSKPGKYHLNVTMGPAPGSTGGTEPTPTAASFTSASVIARPDSGGTLANGYVFSAQNNLWLLSADRERMRRLTFYPAFYEYAGEPSWSHDGKTIAYAYSPRQDSSTSPSFDIWGIAPDGSGARALVTHTLNSSIFDPTFSADDRYLYFTSEATAGISGTLDLSPGVSARHIERVDLKTGVREQWLPSAQMPRPGGPSGEVVYLEEAPAAEQGAAPRQRVAIAQSDGSGKRTLATEKEFQGLFAPAISPDGKYVIFAGINVPPPQSHAFDLLSLFLLRPPTAYAHGLPWDLYLVPSAGGQPSRLTQLSEDQPYPLWLDSRTAAFMGVTGLYKLAIEDGKLVGDPSKEHDGAPHGGLAWHAP